MVFSQKHFKKYGLLRIICLALEEMSKQMRGYLSVCSNGHQLVSPDIDVQCKTSNCFRNYSMLNCKTGNVYFNLLVHNQNTIYVYLPCDVHANLYHHCGVDSLSCDLQDKVNIIGYVTAGGPWRHPNWPPRWSPSWISLKVQIYRENAEIAKILIEL